ncbi:MAG: acetyl-CoA C-acyltransferase [Pirellulaceae bacterium]|nr:acetyl-CoA C-acyltransferase [Pirellulaceae bacterium]
MNTAWIVSGARTPIGKYLGELAHHSAPRLAGFAIEAAVAKAAARGSATWNPDRIDEVIVGQVVSAGAGQAPARQAALLGGIPNSTGCATVNKVCGSGLYAVMLADRAIRSGAASVVVAGGMESMSQAPHLLRGGRAGWKYGAGSLLDAVELDGLTCASNHVPMGCYAEQVAQQHGISRREQDEWSLQSHLRAVAAGQSGAFADEIVAVPGLRGESVAVDGSPRADSSADRLAKLKPAFQSDGSVTAGNASSLSDGAAAVVVVDQQQLEQIKPSLAFRIVGAAVHAAAPSELFTAPVGAIQRLLRTTARNLGDIDLFEINEAFASQTLACMKLLDISPDKLNVHGGAIALGHPIGCSGARVLVTLMHALVRHQKSLGVASLCLGGGEAVALMIEVSA